MEKMFEKLTRKKARFSTTRGNVSVEDLWDLPLSGIVSLDSIARALSKTLGENEQSFVTTTRRDTLMELKFEAVKYIISVKLEEKEALKNSAAKKAEKEKLLDALDKKEAEELQGESAKALRKKIAALDD